MAVVGEVLRGIPEVGHAIAGRGCRGCDVFMAVVAEMTRLLGAQGLGRAMLQRIADAEHSRMGRIQRKHRGEKKGKQGAHIGGGV